MNTLAHSVLWAILLLNPDSGFDVSVDLGPGLGGGAVGAFLTTHIVGGILLAVLPDYTMDRMTSVAREPIPSFLYGLLGLLGLVIVTVVLFLTLIGILVAIPLAVVTGLVWGVGAAIGYLAVADRLIGHDDGWLKPLLIAGIMNGGLTITGVGGLVSFAVGATGFGAVIRGYLG
jgi:hypothetical protein